MSTSTDTRRILIVSHFARTEAFEAAAAVLAQLDHHGVVPVLEADMERALLARTPGGIPTSVELIDVDCVISDIELVIVLGGDGTILRGVELARPGAVPVLGVNLGHVGFLAESERDSLPEVLRRVLARDYEVEERLALDLAIEIEGQPIRHEWALNDASIEKGNRERMVDAVIEVDGEPLSSFGCDGVLLSTPTGSTAYNFSVGGPIVWPQVEALLIVPISAHALFAKPLVVGPDSRLAVEVHPRGGSDAIMWCDGRRGVTLPDGARITATRSAQPVLLARLHHAPFTQRLVNKFRLPITGWRGPRVEGTA